MLSFEFKNKIILCFSSLCDFASGFNIRQTLLEYTSSFLTLIILYFSAFPFRSIQFVTDTIGPTGNAQNEQGQGISLVR